MNLMNKNQSELKQFRAFICDYMKKLNMMSYVNTGIRDDTCTQFCRSGMTTMYQSAPIGLILKSASLDR